MTTPIQRFVYLVEGEPYVGTVADYARAYENAYYSGLDINPDVCVFTVADPASGVVTAWDCIKRSVSDFDEDDYANVTFNFNGETASIRLDGRV